MTKQVRNKRKGYSRTGKRPIDNPNDPTPEQIWGTETVRGLAELIRMERGEMHNGSGSSVGNIRVCMLPQGFGKLLGDR